MSLLTEQQIAKLNKVQLDESWKYSLSDFLLGAKMDALKNFLIEEKKADKVIYPPNHLIFNALNTTPLHKHLSVLPQKVVWVKTFLSQLFLLLLFWQDQPGFVAEKSPGNPFAASPVFGAI